MILRVKLAICPWCLPAFRPLGYVSAALECFQTMDVYMFRSPASVCVCAGGGAALYISNIYGNYFLHKSLAGWITLQEWMLNMQSTPVVCPGLGYRRTTVKKEDWQNNSSNYQSSSLLESCRPCSSSHSENRAVTGEGSRFLSKGLYQQVTADFNNNNTVPVGQVYSQYPSSAPLGQYVQL